MKKQLRRARRRYLREHRQGVVMGHRVTYRVIWTETEDGVTFRIKLRRLVKCPHCRSDVPTGLHEMVIG